MILYYMDNDLTISRKIAWHYSIDGVDLQKERVHSNVSVKMKIDMQ